MGALPWIEAGRAGRVGADLLDDGRWAGLDVAGSVETARRWCGWMARVLSVEPWQGRELSETAGKAAQAIRDGYHVNIDGAGMGAAITSHLQGAGFKHGKHFTEVQVASRALTPDRYPRLRDELWAMRRSCCVRSVWT